VYKFLLCLRYLRTRYLAFVCIVSIMLGVATLIVVNSVMSGFANKLRDRLHGVLSDLIVDTENFAGFPEPPDQMAERILQSPAGPHVAAVAPTVETIGFVQFNFDGMNVVKPVKLTGVDPVRQAKVGGFAEYVFGQRGKEVPSFDLSDDALKAFERRVQLDALLEPPAPPPLPGPHPGDFLGAGPRPAELPAPPPPMPAPALPAPEPVKPTGIIIGWSLAHFSYKDPQTGEPKTVRVLKPGDPVLVATLGANEVRPVWSTYVVADYFKSEMSEYDSQFVYMPLGELQKLRKMDGRASHLQVKLKPGLEANFEFVKKQVKEPMQALFPPHQARVATWQEHQGPLLAAIDIERGILNLLLFMIVGVAGFSILAIFTMIVSEKYRDIGILKSLGASSGGVMGIFVWYAVLLGVVGCAAGTALGVGITQNINEIEARITALTGQQLFDRSVYYFDKIPTNVEPLTVALVNFGALTVAVISSLLPAVRAARLTPIRALRFE
jgi:lipoprotein-releasing system permease protein